MTPLQIMFTTATDLERRVWGEYREMPGHRLTLAQACRLWGADAATSAAVLDRLCQSGRLRHIGPYYFRSDLGHFTA